MGDDEHNANMGDMAVITDTVRESSCSVPNCTGLSRQIAECCILRKRIEDMDGKECSHDIVAYVSLAVRGMVSSTSCK